MYRISGINSARFCFSSLILWVTLAGAAPDGNPREPQLVFPTAVVARGDTGDARIEYHAKGSALSGLQFELEYDPNVLAITAAAGDASTAAGKTLATAVQPNGNLRILIIGLNQTVIADGTVVDLKIQVGPYASAGPYKLRFVNTIGVTPDAKSIPVGSREGQVVAVPGK